MSSEVRFSDFDQFDGPENEIDDPISAYFKQRCGNNNKTYFQRRLDNDSDSSGVIEVDGMSFFGDGLELDKDTLRLSRNSFPEVEQLVNNLKNGNTKKLSNASQKSVSDTELNLEKQRFFAQKALLKVHNNHTNETQSEDFETNSYKSINNVSSHDLSGKMKDPKMSLSKNTNWFQPNITAQTPRCFNDELSSFGGSECSISRKESDTDLVDEVQQGRQSEYAKKVSLILDDLNKFHIDPDLEFECESKEEAIIRLEEDEKKFKLENSALLHNSEISQFSGVAGNEIPQWPSEPTNLNKADLEPKKISIGQFFNMRSNRVSSLVGSVTGSETNLHSLEQSSNLPTLTEDKEDFSKNENAFPVVEISEISNTRPRRCLSTFDLKRPAEVPKVPRYSNDSCGSNSTVMIQNIIAEMDSGLSGTEIYEKLMKCYGKKEISQKENKNPERLKSENHETPKSSKLPYKKEILKKSMKQEFAQNTDRGTISKYIENKTPVLPSKKPPFDLKENNLDVNELKVDENNSSLRNEKMKKLKGKKGFDSSTPKTSVSKPQCEKAKMTCTKALVNTVDWDTPRVSAIKPTIDLNGTKFSEDNDKTLTVNSSISAVHFTQKNDTIILSDTLTIEDTIVAGDLTVLSQRINEMKEESVCIVRPKEHKQPLLLTVVQEVANLPKGSVNCSALTPLLRDEFPELLSTFPTPPLDESSMVNVTSARDNTNDILVSEPGSWIKMPERMGFSEQIFSFGEVTKTIFVPLTNTSGDWLLASIRSVVLIHLKGKKLNGVKKNDKWNVFDFVSVCMKDTLISPNGDQTLELQVTPKIPTKVDLKLSFSIKQLLGQEIQTKHLQLQLLCVNPLYTLNVIPKDSISFGIMADQCFDHRNVQISFDGISELPLIVFIEEETQTKHFFLKPNKTSPGKNHGEGWSDGKFRHKFRKGDKQVLSFQVFFQPNVLLDEKDKIQQFKATVKLKIDTQTESDGVLKEIPVKGSVGYTKFLWSASNSPLVFRTPERGQPITRSLGLKNLGSIPIAFSVKVVNEESQNELDDDLYTVPKTFYLSTNEESPILITFNATAKENYTKRTLKFQIIPNGRASYDIEMIGIITKSESRPGSRASNASGSTKSTGRSDSVPIKLLTTTTSLSWPAMPLEREVRQTFQLKNGSGVPATVRISFKKNLDSFRFVNENGEKVQKLRKMLKPNSPTTLTVVFRPDFVGTHHNLILLETNNNTKKMVAVSGIGGMPNLFIGNVKSDLNGCKMLKLQNPSGNQIFYNTLVFKNEGRIPGFILIKTSVEVLSLSHELTISPSSCVIGPDSSITVQVSQKLKNDDLQALLSGKDISKVATISIIMGDEPSRLRLRKMIDNRKIVPTERVKNLIKKFDEEKEMDLKVFEDSPAFENQFLKSLRVVEVATVVEKATGIWEPTILVDDDDSQDGFVTIYSVLDTTMISSVKGPNQNILETQDLERQDSKRSDGDATLCFSDSMTSNNKIAKWLESIELDSSNL